MTKLIRRVHVPLSICCVLAAAFALPYLVPGNPDSAVFRSGSLSLILLLALYFPVTRALSHQPLRALLYGAGFAYVLALCAGLGCELEFYNGLLPGMGSLLRRFAAPAMIAPALGSLFSFVFTFEPAAPITKRREIPFSAFFAVLAVCYGLVLLALYPGVISYDFEHEIAQFQSGEYNAAHPVFHTLFLGAFFSLGEALFGSMTAGAAVYSGVQLLLLAALYAWALCFVQRRVPRAVTLLLLALFALLPFHGVLAVSTAKDPLFAGLCTALCLMLWELCEDPKAFLSSRLRIVRFVLCCLLIVLLRHNGVFAYVPAIIAVAVLCRRQLRRALTVALAALMLCILVPKGLEMSVGASKTPGSELMSVPCQQLMRTAARADVTQEEYDQIAPWFSGAIHRYRENCADPAKGGNFDYARFIRTPKSFLKMYLSYGLKYPRVYIEAFLENSIGIWYPGDTSHAHTLSSEEGVYIYLNTVYPFTPERYPIEPACYFEPLQKLLYASMHHAKHENLPVIAQLFCPATYTFALLLSTLILFYKKQRPLVFAQLPMLCLTASVFFAAGVFVRYAYPMMAAAPLLFSLVLFSRKKDCA